MGKVTTVLGDIPAAELGRILPHEHVLCDLTPLSLRSYGFDETRIALDNVFDVAYRPTLHPGNHRLTQLDVAARELRAFAAVGGGTIVDMTTSGITPDPAGLAQLASETGVHIVLGAGFYTAEFAGDELRGREVGALADAIESQLAEGVAGTSVRAGLIGEIGCSWPLADAERNSLAAAALAQRRRNVAINVHPGRHPGAPHEILDLLDAAGADIARVAISHIDRTYFDHAAIAALARRDCWIEFDFFGIETSNYWFGSADLPTDWMRLRYIRQLIDEGHGDRLLLSHDICTRTRLGTYGGHGYGHLLRNVVPLMRDRGFSEAQIDRLFIDNPRRFLADE